MGRAKDRVNSPRNKSGKFEADTPKSLRTLRRKEASLNRKKNK